MEKLTVQHRHKVRGSFVAATSSSSIGATTLGGFWPALRFRSTIFYLYTSLSSFSLSSSLNPLLLVRAISVLVFLLVLMNVVPRTLTQNCIFKHLKPCKSVSTKSDLIKTLLKSTLTRQRTTIQKYENTQSHHKNRLGCSCSPILQPTSCSLRFPPLWSSQITSFAGKGLGVMTRLLKWRVATSAKFKLVLYEKGSDVKVVDVNGDYVEKWTM